MQAPMCVASLLLCVACAQKPQISDGIGDWTFPHLGEQGYKVSHYDLKLNCSPENGSLKGDVTMTATANQELKLLQVDFSGFKVSKVMVNGSEAKFDLADEKLIVTPPAPIASGATFKLETVYAGKPAPSPSKAVENMGVGWFNYPGGSVAVCEPDKAHTWFPCNDHPLEKATYNISVSVPEGYSALANGIDKGGVWVEDQPIQTCMVTVAVGKWDEIDGPGPHGLTIRNFVPRGSKSRYARPLAKNGEYLQFLEGKLGPYPYRSYGTISLPDESGSVSPLLGQAALETVSIPVFGAGLVDASDTLVHEMCHQWMGDCVSVTNWASDIWWVEGFATYSEHLWLEHEKGHAAYMKDMDDSYREMSAGRWVPLSKLGVQGMFSGASYGEGCMVFHALRLKVGDEKFFKIIRTFIGRHKYGNATTQDLVSTATEVAGEDMKPFFDPWLNGDRVPELPTQTQ